jgi:hypothetical protein
MTTSIEVPMRPSATCEVTVQNEAGTPTKDAVVAFNPNQKWIGGTNLLGVAYDSVKMMRGQLASGVHHLADRSNAPFKRIYEARTDARGVAIVRELPTPETDDRSRTRVTRFRVLAKGYRPNNPPMGRAGESVTLVPGEKAHTTVRLKHE